MKANDAGDHFQLQIAYKPLNTSEKAKQSKKYLLLIFWDMKNGICQKD